jgi:hypothetical protein
MKRGHSKLSVEAIRAIKHALSNGTKGSILAMLYGVTESHISLIKHNKRWSGFTAL